MNASYFQAICDYNYWAHRRVWECVLALSEEQFTQLFDFSIGSVHQQLVHVMGAEWIWLTRLKGDSPKAFPTPVEYPTREAIRQRWDEIEAEFRDYVAGLTDERLTQVINYTSMEGIPYQNSAMELLAHVFNHSTDHRAQILSIIHQLGGKTVEQDIILYWRRNG